MDNILPEHLDQENFIGFWKRVLASILDLWSLESMGLSYT